MFSRITGSLKRIGFNNSEQSHNKTSEKQRHVESDEESSPSCKKSNCRPERHAYSRPYFLRLSSEEEMLSRDFRERPVIVSNEPSLIPLGAGYAECINGGKSEMNEDEAAVGAFHLPTHPNGLVDAVRNIDMIDVQYFGIFDGHAGAGAALMAADQLINHLQEKLVAIQDDLFLRLPRESTASCFDDSKSKYININIDILVTGALESAFCDFDEHIAREKNMFNITGGCAAIVVLVMMDRVYVAHAGDCRAVAYIGNDNVIMAREFTPMTDSERIQAVANLKPDLTYSFFSDNYFLKPLSKKDLGTQVYCRLPHRRGWYYKEVTEEDLSKPSLVAGQGKFARLMGTIGVTRGFGDHNLVMPGTSLQVKPFLTPVPEVRVLPLSDRQVQENDILVVGCDGLWDLLTNEEIGASVKASLEQTSREKLLGQDRFNTMHPT
ncbi:hypothetical protein RRG08_008448 [Elysia crispata]|uniref:PPM-type phosphatase domain-containing protein n=1 Tax=Elysia crispata TaxID=231223 RepID=A0AAE1B306_9GAST|nr:hypothetical protein RRG08_008448 [Elysia crispata]